MAASSATSGSHTATTPNRRPDIQGLRAIAVLWVIAAHAELPVPGGFTGVDIFFVISGYVITAMLIREWTTTGTINFTQFYIRRFKRLTPPLAAMLVATILLGSLVLSPSGIQQNAAKTAIGASLLAANYVISTTVGGYFDGPAKANALLHTWSLSVEEQFYVVFPAALFLGWWISRRTNRRGGPLLVVCIIGALSIAATLAGLAGAWPDAKFVLSYYSPFTRAWEFAAGAVLALVPPLRLFGRRTSTVMAAAGVAALLASLWLITDRTPFPGPWTVLPVLGTMLVLRAGSHSQNGVTSALSRRLPVTIGDWSYSLYLWHWPFIVFARVLWPDTAWAPLLGAVLSIAPAAASYLCLEQPLRHVRTLGRKPLLRLAAASFVVPLVGSAAFGYAAQQNWWSNNVASARTQAEVFHWGYVNECMGTVYGMRTLEDCLVVEGSGAPVYLVGDSNADQFAEAVGDAAHEADRPAYAYSFASCPLIDAVLTWGEEARRTDACTRYREQTMQSLAEVPSGVVILANSDHYLRDDGVRLVTPDGTEVMEPAQRLKAYGEALGRTITQLREDGHRVVVVNTIPSFRKNVAEESLPGWRGVQSCTNVELLVGTCRQTPAIPLSEFEDRQGVVWEETTRVARSTGASSLDLRSQVCPRSTCGVWQGSRLVYRDSGHLTVAMAHQLAPQFAEAIRQAD